MNTTNANVGPIARAQVEKMIEDAKPEIFRLMPEAIHKGATVTFLVNDPVARAVPEAALSAQERSLIALANGKPLVALLPTPDVVRLLRGLSDLAPELRSMLKAITTERRADAVPVVLTHGTTFGLLWAHHGTDLEMALEVDE